jgi:hypothetical protein
LAGRHDAAVHLLYAYEGEPDETRDAYLQGRVSELVALELTASAVNRSDKARSWDLVLAARETIGCDLVIMDAPYLDDFNDLGTSSAGTHLDMLLARCSVPLLIVRAPQEEPREELEDVWMATVFSLEENASAAGWAFQLISRDGTMHVLVIADTGRLESIEHLLQDVVDIHTLDDQILIALECKDKAGLIGALQRTAVERDLQCTVRTRIGEALHILSEEMQDQTGIAVITRPKQRDSDAYQRVLAVVRNSRHPVLVV